MYLFFIFVFYVLFVVVWASAHTSESFFDDYQSGCKDIGIACLVQGFHARIESRSLFYWLISTTQNYQKTSYINFSSDSKNSIHEGFSFAFISSWSLLKAPKIRSRFRGLLNAPWYSQILLRAVLGCPDAA